MVVVLSLGKPAERVIEGTWNSCRKDEAFDSKRRARGFVLATEITVGV